MSRESPTSFAALATEAAAAAEFRKQILRGNVPVEAVVAHIARFADKPYSNVSTRFKSRVSTTPRSSLRKMSFPVQLLQSGLHLLKLLNNLNARAAQLASAGV